MPCIEVFAVVPGTFRYSRFRLEYHDVTTPFTTCRIKGGANPRNNHATVGRTWYVLRTSVFDPKKITH